ncbi:MAG: flagellar motor protein MotB [Qingshengfaniella sp.]
MSDKELAPIIIKRRKSGGGDGHHGGAWKVAYADFVTAMMAFFLLMWLLNATTEKQRKGLADYFSPSIPISGISSGGDNTFWGDSSVSETELIRDGEPLSGATPDEDGADQDGAVTATGDAKGIAEAEQMLEDLKARGGESIAKLLEQPNVVTRVTDEGLVIDIFSMVDLQIFDHGGSKAQPILVSSLGLVADVLKVVRNRVAIDAHMPAKPVIYARDPAWGLSMDRAGTARRLMEEAGFDPLRIQRVTGFADRKPVTDNPMSVRNERIEIIVLRDGA